MKTRQLPSTNDPPILTSRLQRLINGRILTYEVSNYSPKTIEKRWLLMSKYSWYLHSRKSERDVAILYFLLDTGVRISDLCDLKMAELDMWTG